MWPPLAATANVLFESIARLRITVPCRKRDVPNRSTLLGGNGSSAAARGSGSAETLADGEAGAADLFALDAIAQPVSPVTSAAPRRSVAASSRREPVAAARAATGVGTAFDHGAAANAVV